MQALFVICVRHQSPCKPKPLPTCQYSSASLERRVPLLRDAQKGALPPTSWVTDLASNRRQEHSGLT